MTMIESLQRAIDYMEEHLLEAVSIEAVAEQTNVSPYHFQRIFMICWWLMKKETMDCMITTKKTVVKYWIVLMLIKSNEEQKVIWKHQKDFVASVKNEFHEVLFGLQKDEKSLITD